MSWVSTTERGNLRTAERPAPSPEVDPNLTAGPDPGAQSQNGTAPHTGSAWTYQPGLEGLRGLAVLVVLFFHGGFPLAKGGFLGVSTFFTLSGFLITSLLVREREERGRIVLSRFWKRRFRRLVPASLAAILLSSLYVAVAGDPAQKQKFGADAGAALFNVANWRFLLSGQSYADLFNKPSPLLHFWSLAIEEQFYLIFPLLCFGVLVSLGWSRRHFGTVLAVLLAGSIGLSLFGHLSVDAMYYSTATRAAELLAGALLAVIITDKRLQALTSGQSQAISIIGGLGAMSLAVCLLWWTAVPQSAPWLYRGGLTFYSLMSISLILAAILPFGPVRSLLATRPLRELGVISYGVYAYHWPVFLWLSPGATGLTTAVLFVPRVLLSLAVAFVSYRYFEQPIRHGGRLLGVRPTLLWMPGVAVAGVAALAITTTAPPLTYNFAAQQKQLAAGQLGGARAKPAAQPGQATAALPRTTIFGDSTALTTGFGLNKVFADRGAVEQVPGDVQLGCSLARSVASVRGPNLDRCNWGVHWPPLIQQYHPQFIIVQFGPWEVEPQRLPGPDRTFRTLGDPIFDNFERQELLAAVDTLTAAGGLVVWLTAPEIGAQGRANGQQNTTGHNAPMSSYNRLVQELPALRPGKVAVVDLGGWMANSVENTSLRADGVHFTEAGSEQVANDYLANAVLDAYHSLQAGHP